MSVAVLGAGAFGTALALTQAREGRPVTLWARDAAHAAAIQSSRANERRLPGHVLPDAIAVTGDLAAAAGADILLVALPLQQLASFLAAERDTLSERVLVACCKGIDLKSGLGPAELIRRHVPAARAALLSGPGFAADIAEGLPTALTLAAENEAAAGRLQEALATATLRLYRSTDLAGVELGGALKNVVAIACGLAIGAGLGDSARASLLTRGFAEMQRFAQVHGARPDTLAGLSGLGDLVLTATSEKSRNYAYGLAVGRHGPQPPEKTTEGIATARAVARIASDRGLDMPVAATVAAVLEGNMTLANAAEALLSRPLTRE